jgi:teichuronic acid biosynthesis glycosyltransferase TuaC
MEILTFTSLFPNATKRELGVFIYQRVAHVARLRDNAVRVIAPVPFLPRWFRTKRWQIYRDIPREEEVGGINVSHPRYPLLPGLLMPLHGLLMFLGCLGPTRRLQRQFRFTCIDAHYVYPDGFAAVLLGKMLKVPVIVSARGTDINVFPSFRLIRPMIRWTLRHATGLIAVSDALKHRMVLLGISADKIRVIPNGVDVQRFFPVDRLDARRRLGLQADNPIIVSVGSLTPAKRHDMLIRALSEVAKQIPEIRAYIVGEGSLHSKLQALIDERRMNQQIFLVGGKPNAELHLWFSAADASCLASSREGWPNVVMESIACGTPVVATRVGGIPEILVSLELGLLVDEDAHSLAAGICAALKRPWDRQGLVRSAESRTWEAVAEEVVEYFQEQVPPQAAPKFVAPV